MNLIIILGNLYNNSRLDNPNFLFMEKKEIGEENIEIGKIERKNYIIKINNLKNTMVLVN